MSNRWLEAERIAELEAKLELYRYALQKIADEEDTLGWLYAARIAKTALGEK